MISHNWSPMKRLIWLRGSGITGGAGTYETITGNPVSFTAKAAPLKQLSVAFAPVQSGTGDPSPDNVRPISGWDSLTVYHSGADTSNPQTISISIGETVYSGTVDVVTGAVTVTRNIVDLGTLSWSKTNGIFYRTITGIKPNGTPICTNYARGPNVSGTGGAGSWADNTIRQQTDGRNIYIKDTSLSSYTVAGFKTAMSGVMLCYELSEPITIQLTPQEVSTLVGTNTMWSNANGDLTVTYAVDPATTPIVGTGKVGQAIIGG